MLDLKLNHVSKRGHSESVMFQPLRETMYQLLFFQGNLKSTSGKEMMSSQMLEIVAQLSKLQEKAIANTRSCGLIV